jgi:DNA-directed RNA polymerase alpha subunit
MSVRETTTVCLNKANTRALRALAKPGETVNALANRLLAEKLLQDAEKLDDEAILLNANAHMSRLLQLPVDKLQLEPAAMMIVNYLRITTIAALTNTKEKDLRKAPLCLNSAIANIKTQLLRYGLRLKD